MAKVKLARSKTADQFYREIGKKPNGQAARIYLGDDETLAGANVTRLVALWNAVEERWRHWDQNKMTDDPFPCWDDVTLTLARAIGKGAWSVTVEPPDDGPEEVAAWLATLRSYFPMIRADVEDPAAAEEGSRRLKEVWQKDAEREEATHAREMRKIKDNATPFGGKVATRETLHDALDAYKAWIEKSFVDIEGVTT